MTKKKTCYFFYPNDGGVSFHRTLQPARFCQNRYKDKWNFEVGPGPAHGRELYYFAGLPDTRNAQNTLLEIQYLRRKGAKFVWSVDDDWLSIPEWNPANPGDSGLCVYDVMKELADYVVVSTPYLAETFKELGDKVLIAPNLLDLSLYPQVPFNYFTDNDGRSGKQYEIKIQQPVRVVWSGSETHRGDIEEITDPLDRFLDGYCGVGVQQKATVMFVGMFPHGSIVRKYLHKGLFYQAMVPFASYHSLISSTQPAVCLAPLTKIPFNRGKSNLRILESWALCAAPVATSWGEYSTTINHRQDGMISGTIEQFYSDLEEVVNDHELRVSLASHGRMQVEMQYNWDREECKSQWYNVFDRILS